jgi:hypothetical protein
MKKTTIRALLILIAIGGFGKPIYPNKPINYYNGVDWIQLSEEQKLGAVQGFFLAFVATSDRLYFENEPIEGEDYSEEFKDQVSAWFYTELAVQDVLDRLDFFYSEASRLELPLTMTFMFVMEKDYWMKEEKGGSNDDELL